MTRILQDGAEFQDLLFWDGHSGSTIVAGLGSPHAYRIAQNYKIFSPLSELFFRVKVHWPSSSGWDWSDDQCPSFRNGTSIVLRVGIDSLHRICAEGNGHRETSSYAVQLDTPYTLMTYLKIANSGGRWIVYANGNKIIDYTGDTLENYSTVDNFLFRTEAGTFVIDDFAMNDTNNDDGKGDNSWPDDATIAFVPVVGQGTVHEWHGSDGDDIDKYLLVQDIPHDGDTSFVYRDGGDGGVKEQFTVSGFDGTDKTIIRVYPEGRARKTTAVGHTVKLGILPDGGTDQMTDDLELQLSYKQVIGTGLKLNPVDNEPWEEDDINALEVISEIGTAVI